MKITSNRAPFPHVLSRSVGGGLAALISLRVVSYHYEAMVSKSNWPPNNPPPDQINVGVMTLGAGSAVAVHIRTVFQGCFKAK